ncbi:MAG TPA: hypothetical protein VF571_09310 [Pyrinomonadaceae bacterium]|jgi:hypothetical protein
MENYEKLRGVIQQANPEIMELKFGCEFIRLLRNCRIISYTPYNPDGWRLKYIDIGSGVLEDKLVFPDNFRSECQILGRPIRLADVLLVATEDKSPMFYYENLISKWNLKNDNLDHQSDETKRFLIELLVK